MYCYLQFIQNPTTSEDMYKIQNKRTSQTAIDTEH